MKKTKDKVVPMLEQKPLVIMSAALNDGLCNYSYDIKMGVGAGNSHAVKGKGIVDDDLAHAFFPLNTHLAIIDDVFKHSDIEIDSINKFYTHELTAKYTVTGFKITGEEGSEQVILIGTKHVSCSNAAISIQTPKIPMDDLSSYQFHQSLKNAIEKCREEVELYHGGKYTEVEPTVVIDAAQMTISQTEEEFTSGKV
jgi:hypothetical protein